MKRKKIVVFKEGNVSVGSVITSLNGSFRNTAITPTTARVLKNDPSVLNEDTLAFVLPGIIGEHSPYKNLLGKEGNNRIRRYVENGGVFIGFCAGAYYACESITYKTPWGITKSQKPGLDFFKATAHGPLSHQGQKFDSNNRWSDVRVVQVEYTDKHNKKRHAHICYGNGPSLTHIRNDDVTILARYNKVPGKPVAMASRPIGQGLAIFIGVHPEISTADIRNDALHNLPAVKKLVANLSPHEQERQLFWNRIVETIKAHNINLGRAAPSLLKKTP